MSGNLRENLLKCSDKILGIREQIGAQLKDVSIITRTWSGRRPGDGTFSDEVLEVKPTPEIVDLSHDVRITNVGAVKAGDLILRGVSRNSFPDELVLRTDTTDKKVEKVYKVGKHFYHVVNIKENLITWDIQIRKIRFDRTEVR